MICDLTMKVKASKQLLPKLGEWWRRLLEDKADENFQTKMEPGGFSQNTELGVHNPVCVICQPGLAGKAESRHSAICLQRPIADRQCSQCPGITRRARCTHASTAELMGKWTCTYEFISFSITVLPNLLNRSVDTQTSQRLHMNHFTLSFPVSLLGLQCNL